ncbi:MAG: dihydrolipoyl dehydrogenase [Candidatus Thermoplasmatota archaeon]|nr:dihydrolipoyl dehydrogenase [Candidatus Thermoplasmatota archaeon]MBS3790405.1 dihydrolipoyl dehydrogenase [Candidatus Thermoplasmatota archaeon]
MDEDLTIIGSGPGGYVAAVLASKKGLDVTVIEKGPVGGVCTNYGCIPSKALLSTAEKIEKIKGAKREGIKAQFNGVDFEKVMSKKERAVNVSKKAIENLFEKHGINLIEGEAEIISSDKIKVNGEVIESDYIIIATGSEPISLPDVQIDEEDILSSKKALELDRVPDSLLIIGGGYIGLEMAYIYSSMGSEVTIVELLERLIPNMDRDLSAVAEKMMKRKRVKFFTGSKVTEVEKNGPLKVQLEGETEDTIEVDKVLCAVGRTPTPPENDIDLVAEKGHIEVDDSMRTEIEGIYAIGDVNGKSMLAHSAFKQAEIAVKDISGHKTEGFSGSNVPAGIYTHPEMASVGLTEEQAHEKGSEINVGKFPISATGRGSSTGERMGIAKIITGPKNKILGVHLACPGATDIIMEANTAIENDMTAEELGELIHPHPTYSEAIKEAAENVSGESVHSGENF